ncbi:LysM peptidoglycan-binding domain-containing protein [Listeria sp. PSOL-1]|uniref:LysM peptidoglycan-binding domain-containing protein n=1 Tax=Listeria sp. PSOL-1 TaxID=1844999 RepID=UPI0013D38B29|nr:LysM peptidoglycan-binding domain-containing protein [Listeria sp. PSOL-1]
MEKTRKERIIAAKQKLKLTRKYENTKKGATMVGLAAIASSSIVPAFATTVQADETVKNTNSSVQSFIDRFSEDAVKIADENNLYASVMIAQAILESDHGRSALSKAPNYNLFGIKGNYKGNSTSKTTFEDDGKGKHYQTTAQFRKYPSYAESLQDYANVLQNGTRWKNDIYKAAWKSETKSHHEATKALTGTYATDTQYNTKLNQIIDMYNLTTFDTGAELTTNTYYTVKKGDNLSKIALKYKTTVSKLKEWNNLTANFIQIGQKLVVKRNHTETKPTTNYVVRKGDTLWGIARKHNTSVKTLQITNKLNSTAIYVGQKMNI